MHIQERVKNLQQQVTAAAHLANRNPDEILILAVSKTMPASKVEEAISCGFTAFGENKAQELLEKSSSIKQHVDWHFIGHLQTNKVRQIIDKVSLIHSLDRMSLAEEIQKQAQAIDIIVNVLAEINMAKEESKFGVAPENAERFLHSVSAYPNIRVKGLMTVAPFVKNPEENRKYFREMRNLLVDINSKNIDNISMDVLSMGMTNDYFQAIEEGATIVRIGTGVFGERQR